MKYKKKIEEQEHDIYALRCKISDLNNIIRYKDEDVKKLRDRLNAVEDKYAKLLEKYITTMERTVRINEQREAD